MKPMKIAILGSGPAGFSAAITLAKNLAHTEIPYEITIFDQAHTAGRSILATGNGRCNISNTTVAADDYHNSEFVEATMSLVVPDEVTNFFAETGILLREEEQGRLYPIANKASSVVDALNFQADLLGIRRVLCADICKVRATTYSDSSIEKGWIVSLSPNQASLVRLNKESAKENNHRFLEAKLQSHLTCPAEIEFNSVVYALGGKANAKRIINFGDRAVQTLPATDMLCPLAMREFQYAKLDNIRVRCSVSLRSDGGAGNTYAENGEVLFRKYGVSGICIFNLSRFAQPGDILEIDLFPLFSREQIQQHLLDRYKACANMDVLQITCGILLPEVASAIARHAGLENTAMLTKNQVRELARVLKSWRIGVVEGLQGDAQAQVSRGGIDINQINPATCEFIDYSGIYAIGEALDVDAACGGFNLHWAWTSGIAAGTAIARSAKSKLGCKDGTSSPSTANKI